MKPTLRSDFLKFALVGGVGVIISSIIMAADNTSLPVKTTDLTLPVLTVSQGEDGKWSGKLIDLDLTVSRKPNNRPMLVAIAEDRPSGVGEQFRAAMWSAASAVAFERGDPLRGCKLELTSQEAIDGPSAGAMITFGIMSALDGNVMTNDFAFTGTILPNGSVGYVGGVVQKIEAAKAAGKKRVFVPAYYRAEKDLNTGEVVDLKEKCQTLGLQFVPVSNIRQAYALINNIKETPSEPPNLNLPDKVEGVLTKLYKRETKDSELALAGLSTEEKERCTNISILKTMILDSKDKADSAYRAGNLPAAYDNISDRTAFIEAYKETRQYIVDNNLTNNAVMKYIESFDKELSQKSQQDLKIITNYFSGSSKSLPIAAQFDDFFNMVATWSAVNDSFEAHVSRDLTNAVNAVDEKVKDQFLNDAQDYKFLQLMVANMIGKSCFREDWNLFASLFNEKETLANGRHRAVEQLLFTTMAAAFDAYNANSIKPAAEEANTTPGNVESYLESTDLSYLLCTRSRQTSELFRLGIKDDATLYSLVSLSRSHAHALAEITSQTMKESVECTIDDAGQVRYGNTILLRAMLQSSRDEALAAIGHCQKCGVICWGPIATVDVADAKRDDPDADKMDVFEKYFEAALDAKILALMFSTN